MPADLAGEDTGKTWTEDSGDPLVPPATTTSGPRTVAAPSCSDTGRASTCWSAPVAVSSVKTPSADWPAAVSPPSTRSRPPGPGTAAASRTGTVSFHEALAELTGGGGGRVVVVGPVVVVGGVARGLPTVV